MMTFPFAPDTTQARAEEIHRPATDLELFAMGFDLNRLGFYRWLVRHGKEPLTIEGAQQLRSEALATLTETFIG